MSKRTTTIVKAVDERIEKKLLDIGLTPNEAKVYLGLLSSGPGTVLKISKITGIKRTTIYTALKSLESQGLIHTNTHGFKRNFVADNPERLESVLNSRKNILTSVLPTLSSLYLNIDQKAGFIKHYSGLEGIKTIYDNLLKEIRPKDYYFVISDQEKWIGLDPQYFEKFKKARGKLSLHTKLLLKDSIHVRKNLGSQVSLNEEIKILPQTTSLPTNIVIVPSKVIIIQLYEPIMGLVIENQSIVQTTKSLFEIIWSAI